MTPISELGGAEPLWIQPAVRKREHELRAGEDLVASLRFQRGSLADAEADGHHWTFKRQGFWRPRVTVRIQGSEVEIALFQPHWTGGGVLELADGRAIRLRAANFWQSEWVWEDKDQPLMLFKGRHGIVKAKGAVEIQPGAASLPEAPLLILLGWYLILLHADDSAASSVGATVAATSA